MIGIYRAHRAQAPRWHWWSALILIGAIALAGPGVATAAEPIKVGVLHSLSGTMAISEGPLKEVILMAIDEINQAGGVLGRQVEPVVEDPASNWDLFAEKAKKLLQQDQVATVFGCWTSVSRKSVLPVFERYNGLLFYPVQYEGEECSKNVIYTGATINQQASPAVDYLMSPEGKQKTLLPDRHRLRLSAYDEQDPAPLSHQGKSGQWRGNPRGIHPVSSPRLSDHRRQN